MSKIDLGETVRQLDSGQTPDWVADHLRRYRETGGADGHLFDASAIGIEKPLPCLLMTTIGRRSGEKRISPLVYGRAGEGYVIVGSKGGSETHPQWYWNLLANPAVEVQVGEEVFPARARLVSGEERAKLWEEMAALYPFYRDYQRKTSREIPLFVLEREHR